MTVREWFRGMRQTNDGRALALEMDRLLTRRLDIDGPVYGIVLVRNHADYAAWERTKLAFRKFTAGITA